MDKPYKKLLAKNIKSIYIPALVLNYRSCIRPTKKQFYQIKGNPILTMIYFYVTKA